MKIWIWYLLIGSVCIGLALINFSYGFLQDYYGYYVHNNSVLYKSTDINAKKVIL